jgi:hypothetical protein
VCPVSNFSADYKVIETTDSTVFLVDLNLGNRSVTNDAENVVRKILSEHGRTRKIVYRDSMGDWDELIHDGETFLDFGPYQGDYTPNT